MQQLYGAGAMHKQQASPNPKQTEEMVNKELQDHSPEIKSKSYPF